MKLLKECKGNGLSTVQWPKEDGMAYSRCRLCETPVLIGLPPFSFSFLHEFLTFIRKQNLTSLFGNHHIGMTLIATFSREGIWNNSTCCQCFLQEFNFLLSLVHLIIMFASRAPHYRLFICPVVKQCRSWWLPQLDNRNTS